MTREEAGRLAIIAKAYADGKEIEFYSNHDKEWAVIDEPAFDSPIDHYRIKKDPKYHSFKDAEECWGEMLKHQPFGWVCDDYKHIQIVGVYRDKIEFSPEEGDEDSVLDKCFMTFSMVLSQGYKFVDGTPFGIKEEES